MVILGIYLSTVFVASLFWGISFLIEKKDDGSQRDINGEGVFWFCLFLFIPFIQFVFALVGAFQLIEAMIVKHAQSTKKLEKYQNELNTLYECRTCGYLHRKYQLSQSEMCSNCETIHPWRLKKIPNNDYYKNIYETAREVDVEARLPEINRKKVRSMIFAEQKERTERKAREKKQCEEQQRLQKELDKAKLVRNQNMLHMKKESQKLEKMNEEKEQRKQVVLETLDEQKSDHFMNAIRVFDEIREMHLNELKTFENESAEKITSLEKEIEKLRA